MNAERRTTGGGRRQADHAVTARGPVIRGLAITNALVAMLAVTALILSLVQVESRITDLQKSRYAAAIDDCYAQRTLVFAAYGVHKRPANEVLSEVGLGDCRAYGRRIVKARR